MWERDALLLGLEWVGEGAGGWWVRTRAEVSMLAMRAVGVGGLVSWVVLGEGEEVGGGLLTEECFVGVDVGR